MAGFLRAIRLPVMLITVAAVDNSQVNYDDDSPIDGVFEGLIHSISNSGVAMQTYTWECNSGGPHCVEFANWVSSDCQRWSIQRMDNGYAIRAPFCGDGNLYLQTYTWYDHDSTYAAETGAYDSPGDGARMMFKKSEDDTAVGIQGSINNAWLTSYSWPDHDDIHAGEFVENPTPMKLELRRELYELKSSIVRFEYDEPDWNDITKTKTLINQQTLSNCGKDTVLSQVVHFSKTQNSGTTLSFSETTTLGGGITTTIEEDAGVPLIEDTKLTDEFSFTWSHESTSGTTTTIEASQTVGIDTTVTVNPNQCTDVSGYFYLVDANSYTVPFTAKIKASAYGPLGDGTSGYVSNTDAIVHLFQAAGMTASVLDRFSDTEALVEVKGDMTATAGVQSGFYTTDCSCGGETKHAESTSTTGNASTTNTANAAFVIL